jgi:acetylornithine deacetylase/succinyl-diaminopimelate desuccinylase-like protein
LSATAIRYARANFGRFVRELAQLVAIPSVSGDPARAGDVRRAANRLGALLRNAGLSQVEIAESGSDPVVYAQSEIDPARPTVLVYGHYDVQPADVNDGWSSPPFEPIVRGSDLYGRGASDDKGQVMVHIKALESILASGDGLPVNVKCVFEGAEEQGSPGLKPLLEANRSALAADVAVVSDTRILGPDRPALTYSLRGSLGCEIEVHTLDHDVHSGAFGGAVQNPLEVVSGVLAGLHESDGRIAIKGFYDDVGEVSAAERSFMATQGPSDASIAADASAAAAWGERGYTAYERTTIRPSLSVNGISGGYQGPGGKGVIPAHATAKLSFRLVPAQDPARIEELLRDHLRRVVPRGVRAELEFRAAALPAEIDRDLPVMRAAARAYEAGFGRAPVFLRSGGTIPVVNYLSEVLAAPVVLMGFALPDDGMHAPNEKFHLPQLMRGIATVIAFFEEVARSAGYPKRATGSSVSVRRS